MNITEGKPASTASLFFWYFPSQKTRKAQQQPATFRDFFSSAPKLHADTNKTPPLIIWLQGGPGSSSMIGLFYEMGPLAIKPDLTLIRSNVTWNEDASMLFIDNPVGVGYSNIWPHLQQQSKEHSDSLNEDYRDGYVANQKGVAKDLVRFLEQFYEMFPEQRDAKLYLSGESYAGKYLPSFADGIIQHNKAQNETGKLIPLHGMAIGNGLTDPITQVQFHAPLALAWGLVSENQAKHIATIASEAVSHAERGAWRNATLSRNALFAATKEYSGNMNMYDVRKGSVQNAWVEMEKLLNLAHVKKALNVPNEIPFDKDPMVAEALFEDGMKSVKSVVEHLLSENQYTRESRLQNKFQVLLYQGQFDYRDGILGSTQWISSLNWPGREMFADAVRRVWTLGGMTVGFVTEHANLRRVEVMLAGHLAPKDSPLASKRMVYEFVGI
ncbi:Alpha/Beta hydrolase protein [Chytriomyces cf. hyalinus JEL632]|nr:Alpha/Beta hydrolase protein [Chytriomyces cf. hyalinus JEL632]